MAPPSVPGKVLYFWIIPQESRENNHFWGKATEDGEKFFQVPLYKAEKACYNIQAVSKRAGGSMDRASDSGSEGWGFESLPAYQKSRYPYGYLDFCFCRRDSNHLNANVQWTFARFRLDGIDTLQFAKGKLAASPFRRTKKRRPNVPPLFGTRKRTRKDGPTNGRTKKCPVDTFCPWESPLPCTHITAYD